VFGDVNHCFGSKRELYIVLSAPAENAANADIS